MKYLIQNLLSNNMKCKFNLASCIYLAILLTNRIPMGMFWLIQSEMGMSGKVGEWDEPVLLTRDRLFNVLKLWHCTMQ